MWVYLSCVQILSELEKLSSVELGLADEKEIAHEKMFMLRANMLKYAWEKVSEERGKENTLLLLYVSATVSGNVVQGFRRKARVFV